jgi:hypothetical protein
MCELRTVIARLTNERVHLLRALELAVEWMPEVEEVRDYDERCDVASVRHTLDTAKEAQS